MNAARGLEQVLVKKIIWTTTTGTFYITGVKYLAKYLYSKTFTRQAFSMDDNEYLHSNMHLLAHIYD